MITALAKDRVDFVKLFLEYGISISQIINKEIMEFLYGYCLNSPTSILHADVPDSYMKANAQSFEVMKKLCVDSALDENRCSVYWLRVHEIVNKLCSGIRQSDSILTEV